MVRRCFPDSNVQIRWQRLWVRVPLVSILLLFAIFLALFALRGLLWLRFGGEGGGDGDEARAENVRAPPADLQPRLFTPINNSESVTRSLVYCICIFLALVILSISLVCGVWCNAVSSMLAGRSGHETCSGTPSHCIVQHFLTMDCRCLCGATLVSNLHHLCQVRHSSLLCERPNSGTNRRNRPKSSTAFNR